MYNVKIHKLQNGRLPIKTRTKTIERRKERERKIQGEI